jgi:hypothetical protein
MPEHAGNISLAREVPGTSIPPGITVLDYDFNGMNEIRIHFIYEPGDTSRPMTITCAGNPRAVAQGFAAVLEGWNHVHHAMRKDTNVAASSLALGIDHMTRLVEGRLTDMDVKARTPNVVPDSLEEAFAALLPDGYAWHGGDGSVERGYVIGDADMGARWADPRPLAAFAAQAATVAAIGRSR